MNDSVVFSTSFHTSCFSSVSASIFSAKGWANTRMEFWDGFFSVWVQTNVVIGDSLGGGLVTWLGGMVFALVHDE